MVAVQKQRGIKVFQQRGVQFAVILMVLLLLFVQSMF